MPKTNWCVLPNNANRTEMKFQRWRKPMTHKEQKKTTKYQRVEGIRRRKWDAKKLENSPVSREILEYGDEKFLPIMAIIVLLKCLVSVSCKLSWPRFVALFVAPSRQLKSYTSRAVMKIFAKEFWLDVHSDFTIHSLEKYKDLIEIGVCILINDATTLLRSLAKRTKDRLFGGLSELFSDGSYVNQDFRGKVVDLKGWVTAILNLTSESFKNYEDRMLGLTFLERALTVHYILSKQETEIWVEKEQITKHMKFKSTITIDDIETDIQEIPSHYLELIKIQAREFSYLSMRSFVGSQDIIKAIVRAHAALNKRKQLCTDDFYIVTLIKPYLINPFSPYEGQIVKLRAQGLSYREIQEKIGKKNYVHQIQRVVKKAQIRGILPLENQTRSNYEK